jgi:hypothetical protein
VRQFGERDIANRGYRVGESAPIGFDGAGPQPPLAFTRCEPAFEVRPQGIAAGAGKPLGFLREDGGGELAALLLRACGDGAALAGDSEAVSPPALAEVSPGAVASRASHFGAFSACFSHTSVFSSMMRCLSSREFLASAGGASSSRCA